MYQNLKLNVCCGGRILEGYVNVDVAPETAGKIPDIVADARSIPLPDGCAAELMCIHGFEHFYRWEVDDLATEWKRLLEPYGKLILEMPNIIKCCMNVMEGYTYAGKHPDQAGLWGIYGDPTGRNPFMSHHWGWSPDSLAEFLHSHGFIEVVEEPTIWHPVGRKRRDMRIVARKQA